MQSALAKERRELKMLQREQEMDSIPTGLNKNWIDPLPEGESLLNFLEYELKCKFSYKSFSCLLCTPLKPWNQSHLGRGFLIRLSNFLHFLLRSIGTSSPFISTHILCEIVGSQRKKLQSISLYLKIWVFLIIVVDNIYLTVMFWICFTGLLERVGCDKYNPKSNFRPSSWSYTLYHRMYRFYMALVNWDISVYARKSILLSYIFFNFFMQLMVGPWLLTCVVLDWPTRIFQNGKSM